ncbi:hypothetical protein [Cryptosporangium phraense]|uniref:Uncharacterized protein n=1 Tax=Cryptosporangium phraense TaxID=2593070 RepID=A0A545AZN8_9ACTN|nr:hypothetical protein [Cryptosporangium phraense]TQS46796.1 hypothetical protein FL583_00510 [Cryptosporangium phraense]
MHRPSDVGPTVTEHRIAADEEVRAVLRSLAEPATGGVQLHGGSRAARAELLAAVVGTNTPAVVGTNTPAAVGTDASDCSARGRIVVRLVGPTSAGEVLDVTAAALVDAARAAGHPAGHPWPVLAVPLRNRAHPWSVRFGLLAVHVLPNWPVLVAFEDADADLTDAGAFRDPDLRDLMTSWANAPGLGRLLLAAAEPVALPVNPHRPLRSYRVGAP